MNKDVIFRPKTEKLFDTFLYFAQSDLSPRRFFPIALRCTSPKPYIYYNTEQLTRPENFKEVLELIKNYPPVEIWDYSSANVSILKRAGINSIHVPLKSPSWYVEKLKEMRKKKFEYDVGFCGTLNKRRSSVFNSLINLGLVVKLVQAYGDERDEELAKCRVLINIHYNESYKVFEQLRCEPWLQINVPLISENSLDNDERAINVDYENLVEETNKTVKLFKISESKNI